MAPIEPAAETMPKTRLRSCAETARAETDIASADAVQASEAPMRMPAPTITPRRPFAAASAPRPATYMIAPATMIGRKPKRGVKAPATGCRKPQARFWMAIASVKSEMEMCTSCVSGCMNRPRL